MALKDRWVDPNSPERRPRRAAYALPTLFTAGNIFLGYIAILRTFRGALMVSGGVAGADEHFRVAAQAIGAAVFLDGLDGRIARMTNTTSDFGREMDSLADVISFGLAPAILAFAWGLQFVSQLNAGILREIHNAGYFISFLFLLCGAVRLARFNVQKNPVPKNPGRPNRKYFVGLPIPAAAGMVASVVFASGGEPVTWWPISAAWMALLLLLGFLMVSTWRYYSFKGVNLSKPYTPLILILLGAFIYGMWNYAQLILLAMSTAYVVSGIAIRLGGAARRRVRHSRHGQGTPAPESQIG
jgi:CDP-diacylglycerol--serine O-phosphatidyltransferase